MKKIISLLFVLLFLAPLYANMEQPVNIISVDAFVQRYNEFIVGFYQAFKQKAAPVEAAITETDGVIRFMLDLPNGSIEGKAVNGQVIEVDVLAADVTGSIYIMGVTAAVSSLQSALDAMDPGKQVKHIQQTRDPDIAATNGYTIEIVERFKSGEAKHVIITLLP